MSAQERTETIRSLDAPLAVRLEGLCRELTQTGEVQMQNIVSTLDEVAPKPGHLVFLRAKDLSMNVNGLQPVVFSAVDACTFLQVAQVYLAPTTAAAASFFDHALETFPFVVSHVRSRNQRPFYHAAGDRSYHEFSEIIEEKGCSHSIITKVSQDPLYGIADKFMFGGIVEGSIVGASEGELHRDLVHFLFFHNNCRSIPWLGGRTPLQKLAAFEGFAGWRSFDPFSNERVHNGGAGERRSAQFVSS
ncbi:MAG: hypothetical protein NTU47_17465 [Ignavibacteriales bacterium]|nr:hypothetical protein [Ignavibacteriales bacterium]